MTELGQSNLNVQYVTWEFYLKSFTKWWPLRDSNTGPTDYESGAIVEC